jgi:hypothetical protein
MELQAAEAAEQRARAELDELMADIRTLEVILDIFFYPADVFTNTKMKHNCTMERIGVLFESRLCHWIFAHFREFIVCRASMCS